ncbi:MAG: CPBP family intramembrane metalloprotease [Planctomycetia bacterium]|nr:CPBP family intramembrane metalloprotease [Planctomycetia bacterium]
MTWLLLLLAALPFAAKVVSLVWLANNYVAQSAYKAFQLAAPVLWRRGVDRRRGWAILWPIDKPLPGPSTWAMAVVIAAIAVGSVVAVVPWLASQMGLDPATLRSDIDARFAITPWRAAAVVVFLTAINSALEELHFRAWLDPEMSRRFGRAAGIVTSACAFAGMHTFIFGGMRGVTPAVLALLFAGLFVMAVAWSLLARRPGGIHAAWLSHALADAGLLTWGLFWLGYF